MNVMKLARKQEQEQVEAVEVEADAPEAIEPKRIPANVELTMESKGQKSPNHRELFKAALDDAATVRASVYAPADLGLEAIELATKDAAPKVLDHGEVRMVWDDTDENILVKAFVPADEKVNVKTWTLSF